MSKTLDLGEYASPVSSQAVSTDDAVLNPWCAACALCAACGPTIATWAGVAAFASF